MLKGRVVVVTGATRGIGFATARELAARNATVVVCSRDIATAEKAARRIGKKAHPASLDVTSAKSVSSFVKKVVADHGRIDILVNNAGYPFDPKIWYKKMHRVSDEELGAVLAVDLEGTFRITKAVLPLMVKSGKGVVISISSTPAIAGYTEGAPYSIAKAGIVAMTKHAALEYGKDNVRAYVLALGNIATDATFNSMTARAIKAATQESAMKRWGKPQEVARTIAGLATDDFSFATGNTIVVDGGTVLF
ncbi:SDR family NAD(P)-dependent oxidoreductase [Nitrososphaera sp.]|uniref:SDR family NAD(P)-dependent oxidoreductase n=1 Tax=Nitrososphaera sp. TaxID=1971748 RepID=UPI002ED9C41F